MKPFFIVIHQWLPNNTKTTFTIPMNEEATLEELKNVAYNLLINAEDIEKVQVLKGKRVVYRASSKSW